MPDARQCRYGHPQGAAQEHRPRQGPRQGARRSCVATSVHSLLVVSGVI
jgi:hypothetical protein